MTKNQCTITGLQSRSVLKNIKNFLCKQKLVNNCSIPSMHTKKKNYRSFSQTLFYSISFSQPLRMDGETNTLTVRGLEDFFQVVLLCQFLVLAGNRFWFYILMYLEYNTVVMLCQFFGSGGKQFLTFCTNLVYNTLVRLCQFFGCGGKQFSKCEHVSTKTSYWVTLFDPIADVCIYMT